jgi:hypothetical protein
MRKKFKAGIKAESPQDKRVFAELRSCRPKETPKGFSPEVPRQGGMGRK